MQTARVRIRRRLAPAMLVACALGSLAAVAEPEPNTVQGQGEVEPAEGVKAGHNIVVAPIPISNPSVGSGLALTGMILYKVDADSPESSTALGAGYLSSHSWLAGVSQKLNFDHDLYRLSAALGAGQINYNFYGVGNTSGTGLPLEQKVYGGMVDLRRQLFIPALHIGLRYTYGDVRTSIGDIGTPLPPALDKELALKISGVGLVASWDTRDRQFSPTRGTYAEFKSNFNASALGSDLTYQAYDVAWNAYYSLGASNVLAARVYLCRVSDSAPFFATCAFGSGDDLRGYETGRYRDLNMIAAQAEYRVQLSKRFGAVAFAGVGSVAPSFGDLFSSTALPDAGIGLRWLAVPAQGVNISVDYAWGRDGQNGLYVYIGDAF